MTQEASPQRFDIGHVKIPDFSSEITSNMALKILAIELWVGRQFNLQIFCSNVYACDDDNDLLTSGTN